MTNCYSVVNDAPQWGTIWCVSTHTDTHTYSKTNLGVFARNCSGVVVTHFLAYMWSKEDEQGNSSEMYLSHKEKNTWP